MVVQDTFGDWTVSRGDEDVSPDTDLRESATPVALAETVVPTQTEEVRALRQFSGHLALQSVLVVGSALAVGLLVFGVIRSMAGSDDGFDNSVRTDDALPPVGLELDGSDEDVDQDSSRTGSRRNVFDDGVLIDADSDAEQAVDADASTGADSGSEDSNSQPLTPPRADQAGLPVGAQTANDLNASGTTVTTKRPDRTTTTTTPPPTSAKPEITSAPATPAPTTAAPTTAAPTTTAAPITTSTTEAPTTTTTIPPTTAPPTTVSTTTTTTTTTLPPAVLSLVAPASGRTYAWENGLSLNASRHDGASSYCWRTVSNGGTLEQCGDSPDMVFAGGANGPAPGDVTVTVNAIGGGGQVLASESVSVTLFARDVISAPADGAEFGRRETVRINANRVSTATDYCFSVSQPTTGLAATRCDPDRSVSINTRDFGIGAIDIDVEVLRGTTVIGKQSITIERGR